MPGLRLTAWEDELDNDCGCHFILNGKKQGFEIIDDSADIKPVNSKNYPSASHSSPLYDKATSQVIQEIKNGHYVIYDKPLHIVSLMAAISTVHTIKKEDLYLKHKVLVSISRRGFRTVCRNEPNQAQLVQHEGDFNYKYTCGNG